MADILARIDDITRSASFMGWKFSANGQWDLGKLAYFKHDNGMLVEPVLHWLDEHDANGVDNIAFQAMFAMGSEEGFIGVRMTHLSLEGKKTVIRNLMAAGQPEDKFNQVLQKIRDCTNDQNLFSTAPGFLELGVIALWNRVKGCKVWKPDMRLGAHSEMIMPEELPGKTSEPETGYAPLHEQQPNPLMLEAGWAGTPFQHWIGLPVASKTSQGFVVSKPRYTATAAAYIGRDLTV